MASLPRKTNARTPLSTKERLHLCAVILDTIDRNRERRRDPGIGANIERQIIERELRELERDVATDPGPLQPQIVRMRRIARAERLERGG